MHFVSAASFLLSFLADFRDLKLENMISSHFSVDFEVELNMCFILSAAVIGFPRPSTTVLRISNLITKSEFDYYFFDKRFPKLFHKSNRPHFVGVYRRNKTTWDVGRTLE